MQNIINLFEIPANELKRAAKFYTTFLLIFLGSHLSFSQEAKSKSHWEPFQFFVGTWEGTGEGKFGYSTIEREYQFIMGRTFLLGKNRSIYEKQEKNPEGEIHDNWDFFSYDKQIKQFRLHQFHAEDIIVHSVVDSDMVSNREYEFISESVENFGAGWRAKETYEIINENEFVETFSLARPGKNFQVYVTSHLKRKK